MLQCELHFKKGEKTSPMTVLKCIKLGKQENMFSKNECNGFLCRNEAGLPHKFEIKIPGDSRRFWQLFPGQITTKYT